MPFSICPLCGQLSHLSTTEAIGGPVIGRCFFCWQELAVGDDVVVRSANRFSDGLVAKGARGTITRILTGEGMSVFEVAIQDGPSVTLLRSEIRKARDTERLVQTEGNLELQRETGAR
jgi:hypothetical protein